MKINLDHTVKIKLTVFGIKILKDYHENKKKEMLKLAGENKEHFYNDEITGLDGCVYTAPLLEIMKVFGEYMANNDNPTNRKIIESKEIEILYLNS